MKKIIKDIISILTVILLVNIFSFFIFFRWDFTKTKRYSLSKVSKTSIRNNVEPIVVDFYVTEDLPQDTKKLVKEFRSLLKEYKSLSNVSFTINTIYPDNTEKEFKADPGRNYPVIQRDPGKGSGENPENLLRSCISYRQQQDRTPQHFIQYTH